MGLVGAHEQGIDSRLNFMAENYRAVIDDLSRFPGAWQGDEEDFSRQREDRF